MKNQQVRHINGIYESAHRVLIFFSVEADGIKRAFTFVRYMHSSAEYTARRKFDFITHFLPTSYTAAHSLGQEGISELTDQECWSCVNALLCRPWFHRLWVLQEVLHARKSTIFTCRTNEMDWDHFVIAIKCLHRISEVDEKPLKRVAALHMAIKIQKAQKYISIGITSRSLTENFRSFTCLLWRLLQNSRRQETEPVRCIEMRTSCVSFIPNCPI